MVCVRKACYPHSKCERLPASSFPYSHFNIHSLAEHALTHSQEGSSDNWRKEPTLPLESCCTTTLTLTIFEWRTHPHTLTPDIPLFFETLSLTVRQIAGILLIDPQAIASVQKVELFNSISQQQVSLKDVTHVKSEMHSMNPQSYSPCSVNMHLMGFFVFFNFHGGEKEAI